MYLLDIMDCEYISAIYSGNKEEDNKANAELYLKLVAEGNEKGFCPVLVDKEIMHYVYAPKYGFSDTKEDYCKITKRLIDLASYDCFSVWYGRLLYNYYLDGNWDEEGVKYDLDLFNPPSDKKYIDKFINDASVQNFSFCKDEGYMPYDFSYENHVFVLVPTKEPWEVLAWIPMGGFNFFPNELHQIALAKGLYEQFGARIMYISSVSLEYYVPNPLTKKEDVEKAVKILITADNDVYEEYEVAADRIRGSHNWFMWWD